MRKSVCRVFNMLVGKIVIFDCARFGLATVFRWITPTPTPISHLTPPPTPPPLHVSGKVLWKTLDLVNSIWEKHTVLEFVEKFIVRDDYSPTAALKPLCVNSKTLELYDRLIQTNDPFAVSPFAYAFVILAIIITCKTNPGYIIIHAVCIFVCMYMWTVLTRVLFPLPLYLVGFSRLVLCCIDSQNVISSEWIPWLLILKINVETCLPIHAGNKSQRVFNSW